MSDLLQPPPVESPGLPDRARAWLAQVPIRDPVQRPQALLLQILLLALLGAMLLAVGISLLLAGGAALTPASLASTGLALGSVAGALALLRRGRFRAAASLIVAVTWATSAYGVASLGLSTHAAWLLEFVIPLLLAGLLLPRRALLLTSGLSGALVVGIALRDETAAPVGLAGAAAILFLLVIGLSTLFLDQFAGTLRHALATAAQREAARVQASTLLLRHADEVAAANDELEAEIAERQRAEAELRRRARQQEIVATFGQQALTAPALDLLLVEAITLAAAGLDAGYGVLLTLTPDGQSLLVRSVVGWPPTFVGQRRVAADSTSQAGVTLLENRPVVVDATRQDLDFSTTPALRERGIHSGVSVAIPGPARPFGVFVLHSTDQHTFTTHDIQFLQAVANVLAAAVEREQAEATRLAQAAAEQASQAKSEFLGRMSHELRTPLNAILGFGQLLERPTLPARDQESVMHILKAGNYLLGLINEVLDISRIEAGKLALSPEPVLLRDILQESLDLVQPSAAHRQVAIIPADLATATIYVLADHQRLKQVLLNLLSNAIKYNRQGGSVYVTWEPQLDERLRVSIRDTGRGIPAEALGRLFTPFERLGAEATGEEGTGLGLALAQRLMTALDGTLGVTSAVDQGSIFWITLPLADSPADGATLPLEAPAAPPAALPLRTVLLIDDNLANLRLVERILEVRPQITILPAQQGRQGLELARRHRPDLILLDLQLPDLGGDVVLRRLKDDPVTAGIPVIMLSADATPGQVGRLRAAGALDYLTKPFHVTAFLTLIDQVLAAGDAGELNANSSGPVGESTRPAC